MGYLKREELLRKLGPAPVWNGYTEPYTFEIHLAIVGIHKLLTAMIAEIPDADVAEVRHGEWIGRQKLYGVGSDYVCSVCDNGIKQYYGQRICSECGAVMDGGTR